MACRARKTALAITALVGGTVFIGTALAEPPMTERERELLDRVERLESRLAEVESRDDAGWLTERRAEEIRTIVQDVLADAETRSSLLGTGMAAGWDEGFYLQSANGNFRLNINGQMQFRYIYNHRSNPPDVLDGEGNVTETGDRHRSGFENTRTQLIFHGHIIDANWLYRVQGNYLRSGGRFELEEAFIGYRIDENWTFLAGQFRVPMMREFLVTEPRQQMVERSLVHQEFTAGRTQGVAIDYRDDFLHFTGGFTDGHPATGGFNTTALTRATEYALTGRLEVLIAGEWGQFNDFASRPGGEFGTLLGGAIHYQRGEYGTADPVLEVIQWTFDAQIEFGGANVFAAVVGRHLDDDDTIDVDQFGFVIQGGYFLTDDWEIFARYEWADNDMPGRDLSVITAGVTRYFDGHRLKWTTDLGYGINEVNATFGNGFIGPGGDLAGWRADAPGEDGQIVIRSQLQMLF